MLVLHTNGRKQKFANQNTGLGTLCNGFAELQSCLLFHLCVELNNRTKFDSCLVTPYLKSCVMLN